MIGRIRSVKPELFQHYNLWLSEQTTKLPLIRGFEAIWTLSDREGRFEWKPQILKLNGLPFDNVDPARVMEALRIGGYIGKYLGPDRTRIYGFVLHWPKHQQVNPRETATRIPAPPAEAFRIAENLHTLADLDPVGVLERAGLAENKRQTSSAVIQPALETITERADASTTRASGVGDDSSVLFSSVRSVQGDELTATDSLGSMGSEGTQLDRANGDLASHDLPVAPADSGELLVAPASKSAALPALRGPRTHQAIMDRLAAVSDEIQSGARRALAVEQMRRLAAELVFSYWTVRFSHPKARLDDKREARIMERLKENDDDVSELLYALDGAFHDEFIMGRGKHSGRPPYDGIETILRERTQVERFSVTRQDFNNGKPHKAYVKYLAALGGQVQSEQVPQVQDISEPDAVHAGEVEDE